MTISNGPRIALLTEEKYIRPPKINWYIDQILLEDGLLIQALESLGARVQKIGWRQAGVDYSQFDGAVFSSIWDYYRYPTEFSAWLDKVEGQTTFINSIAQVRDNMDKRYLIRYADMGRAVVPTRLLKKGEAWDEEEWAETLGTEHMVIKPVVGGAAVDTFQWRIHDTKADRRDMKQCRREKDMIIQPFVPSIQTFGEVSHIILGGRYSHSVLKRPKSGDYRVQDDHGGRVETYSASSAEIDLALSWLEPLEEQPVYARVDLVKNTNDDWWLGELELIEPELWLRNNPKSAPMLAKKILNSL
jgi:glutathione synthase/RimK-type ligase-like ATP-grasp enzyme